MIGDRHALRPGSLFSGSPSGASSMTARCRRAWSSSIVQRVYSTWGGHSGQVSPIESRFSDRDGARLGRKAWWWILAGDFERPLPGARICAVLHPAVVLTLADRACLLQHAYCPPPAPCGSLSPSPCSSASRLLLRA